MPTSISALLTEKILQHGPMPFHHFMQIALYHEDMGFYASGKTRTGAQGDFLTPVSPGPVLGQLLAQQIAEIVQASKNPTPLHLVEQGADRGHLAFDLLTALTLHHPQLLSQLQFHLIEPFPLLSAQQKKSLQPFLSKIPIHSYPNLASLPILSHLTYFYSCELLDSFPVRLIHFRSGHWHERFVTQNSARFTWLDRPASAELLAEITRWSIPPLEGFMAELRPAVLPWLQLLATKIQQGAILTLDYGLPASDLYHPTRSAGTLVALRQHSPSPNPLDNPGEQDLTAHLNFTELIEEGKKLDLLSFGPQPFMTALTRQAASLLRDSPPLPEKWTRNFQHLVHPNFFGQTHLALLQTKNLPPSYRPSMFVS